MEFIACALNWSTRMPPLDVSLRPAHWKILCNIFNVELSRAYVTLYLRNIPG